MSGQLTPDQAVTRLLRASESALLGACAGQLHIVGARYSLDTGKVNVIA